MPWFKGLPEHAEEEELQRKNWKIKYEDYQTHLDVAEGNPALINERSSHLLEFRSREDKPQWWSRFERQSKSEGELIDDTKCLGCSEQIGNPEPEKRSLIYSYRFPSQEHKLKAGIADKFQSREAPVALILMATSNVEDPSRNIEFLYSKNRLNIAISRALCLAVVVVNSKLLEIPCGTIEQMKLANTFCWLYKYVMSSILKENGR